MKSASLRKKEEQKRKNILTAVVCVLFIVVLSFAIFLSGYDWHTGSIFGGFSPVGPSGNISGAVPESSEKEDWSYFDDTVFVGDSISFGMASYGYLTFDHVFAKIGLHQSTALYSKCVYTSKTKSHTISEALELAKPGKVIITLGINAIYNYKDNSFYKDYRTLIDKIKKATPDSKIIIQSIFPVTEKWAKNTGHPNYNKYIAYANQKLFELAKSEGCEFLYTYEKLTDQNGFLQSEFSGDGIHLSRQGYTTVFDYILTHPIVSSGYFTEIGAIRPPVVYNNNSSTVSLPDIGDISSTNSSTSSDTSSNLSSQDSTSDSASSDEGVSSDTDTSTFSSQEQESPSSEDTDTSSAQDTIIDSTSTSNTTPTTSDTQDIPPTLLP